MTEEQKAAIEEYRYCRHDYLSAQDMAAPPPILAGKRYALEMAVAECELLGIDMGAIEEVRDA